MSLSSDIMRKLRTELDQLKTSAVTYRAGTVTAIAPLAVDIGASGISIAPVACLRGRSMVIGDKVAVLSIGGRNLIVLGTLDTTPADVLGIGDLKAGAYTAPDTGWLLCNGASLLRTGTYAPLFAKIGTTYGTVDGTHFTLPNLLGRVPLGADPGNASTATGHTAHALGAAGGEETHTLAASEIPAHAHPASSGVFLLWDGGTQVGPTAGTTVARATASNASTGNNTGGGGAHNNLPPYQTLNWFIRYA